MEGIIGTIFLAATVCLVILIKGRGEDKEPVERPTRRSPPSPASRHATRPSSHVSPSAKGAANRFDDSSAKHLSTPRVLAGTAWITDGDTITVQKTQVRLFGIDAPELDHPYGQKAKWALHKLCKGQNIRAEVTDIDHHGRTVAKCFLPDGRDLSAEMVKIGMALDWPKFSGGEYTHLETPDARKKLFLANARQKGHMHIWHQFEARQHRS